jgi:TPR repeat protein
MAQDFYKGVEAFKKWRPLAEQGDAVAQNNLGIMYFNGEGVPQDYILAHMWLNLAAAQGDEMARQNREIVASKMPKTNLSTAQTLARECLAREYQGC